MGTSSVVGKYQSNHLHLNTTNSHQSTQPKTSRSGYEKILILDESNNEEPTTNQKPFRQIAIQWSPYLIALLLSLIIIIHFFVDQLPRVSNLPEPLESQLMLLNAGDLDRHIQVLSSDEFEGRAVGTQGEIKSVNYIASEMLSLGFHGAGSSHRYSDEQYYKTTASFLQKVPLLAITTKKEKTTMFLSYRNSSVSQKSIRLSYADEFSLTTERFDDDERVETSVRVEKRAIIFGGFCITSVGSSNGEVRLEWNDFKHVDVSDKLVLCLVNQPRLEGSEGTQVFGGVDAALTYYGRWTYKLEELRRRRAYGVLLVHTDEMAGYGWNVIRSSALTENLMLRNSAKQHSGSHERPLAIRGWISDRVLESWQPGIVRKLVESANLATFKPKAIKGWEVSMDLEVSKREISGSNVVGALRGRQYPDQAVILTAHHDHLGVSEVYNSVNKSTERVIYHGALDNASGVAKLLAIARVFGALNARGECCKRSLVLLSPTAEEAVLLGSTYYAEHPSAAALSTSVAVINFDGMNVWGKTRDQVGLGSDKSSLGLYFQQAVRAEKMQVSLDILPKQGLYFRSDQLPFARKGVPAIKLTHGRMYEGHEDNYAEYFNSSVEYYERNCYHQSCDSYRYIQSQSDPYAGAMQELRVAFRLLYGLLQSTAVPKWNSTDFLASTTTKTDLKK